MPLAIMGNLIGNEKSGLSTVLLRSAGAHVVQPSGTSGIPASSKNSKHLDRMLFVLLRRDPYVPLLRNSRFLFDLLILNNRTADDRLRLFNDLGQVFGAFKAFRIKLVDLFCAGGPSSKPAAR
jgi:hypothetical protein